MVALMRQDESLNLSAYIIHDLHDLGLLLKSSRSTGALFNRLND